MTKVAALFSPMRRQLFRAHFQPSRVVLCVLPASTPSGLNVITLCFTMYCSYKPPMLAIAIQNVNASHALIQSTDEYVLAVPGEGMAAEAMYCGTRSAADCDKVTDLKLDLVQSEQVRVPGLGKAIANVEMRKKHALIAGDHILVVGEALRFWVRRGTRELPLLSCGPDTRGYRVLQHKGLHRLATVLGDGDGASRYRKRAR
jgi:flavin reductase (DIM6/NTAB) family NADH-FMN oxidoreductase RutF